MTDNANRGSNARLAPQTLAAQALGRVDPRTRALVPPIHPSATYERDADGGYSSGRGYSRPHNPTYDEPQELLATLEGGSDCLLLASGMAAATTVFQSLLPGDHVVAPRVMYWALRKWLVDFAMPWGLDVEFVDTRDLDALALAMRPGRTRLVWIETPANPTWEIADIAAAAEIAHAARARLAVDSTVATPAITRPIEFGADLVIHSATKYLNGHSDVLAGAIVCARQDAFWQRMRAWRRDAGAVLGPFEAWLLLRGMRTLFVRVRQASESALRIARHFEHHRALSHVLYPGLEGHPGYEIAARQMQPGFSGMLSIRLAQGEAAAIGASARVKVFTRATSLGGVESLIEHRASIEGPSTPVPFDLLRLSIGLEDPDDLIADLEQALAPFQGGGTPERTSDSSDAATTVVDASTAQTSANRIRQLIERQVAPLVAERGGEVRLESYRAGIVSLACAGSPGAALPIRDDIRNLIRHYVPEVTDVRFSVTAGTGVVDPPLEEAPDVRLRRLFEDRINPAVATHRGRIALVRVEGDTAHIRLEGGCQGCAMADVTVRQGVEVMIKAAVPEIVAVVDVTDHAEGTDPWFKTKKGS